MGDSSQKTGAWQWGYLIKPDKTATPMLEQLCIGLSRVICKLGPSRTGLEHELRPEQLSTFYRSVGGNLESLFLGPSDTGPSFLYRTLGCFHSLEPTLDPFKTPSIACLTPAGFARWQTIMLLLCPDEHAKYMQQAVKVYNVPRPDGGMFPKSIPREAFPPRSDPEMEGWYSQVLQQLKYQQTRRLKNSPHASPNPAAFDGRDGYFGQPVPRVRRRSRNSRERSSEEELLRPDSDIRRKSEPHILSPSISGPAGRAPNTHHRDGKMRSPSASRAVSGSRPRSATTGNQTAHQQPTSASAQRPAVSSSHSRPMTYHVNGSQPYPPRQTRPPRPTSRGDESAEEASSEDSVTQRPGRSRNVSPRPTSKQKNSLFSSLSNPFSSHKRRHSHDATPHNDRDDSRKRREDMPRSARISPTGSSTRRSQHVQFRNDVAPGSRSANNAPASNSRLPASNRQPRVYPQTAPAYETEFPMSHPLTREQSSGSGTDRRSGYDSQTRTKRKDSIPLRVSTVQGVGGRRYPSTGPHSAGASPGPIVSQQQDVRARYSTAV